MDDVFQLHENIPPSHEQLRNIDFEVQKRPGNLTVSRSRVSRRVACVEYIAPRVQGVSIELLLTASTSENIQVALRATLNR